LSNHEVLMSVSDTGIGLDPEDCHRVFGAFEQVDSSLGRRQQGTGLGLTLARNLVELHGGRIWADSDGPGKGCTFTFSIPITEP
jgi:signal transduction histidine kinase